MNIASVRGRARLVVSVTALLLASACATKSPSSPQMPTPPPSSPSTMPSSSPSKPSSPSSSSSSSSSSAPKKADSSSSSSSSSQSSSSSASKGATAKPAGATSGSKTASGATGTQSAAGPSGAGGAGGGKTEAEQNAEWDEAFYGSLGEFDKRLSNEQAAIEKRRGEIAATGNGGDKGQTDGNGGAAGGISGQVPSEVATTEAGGSPVSGAGSDASSQMGGPGGPGAPTVSGPKFPAPEGTPDGKDDDVVARQLREAAETEKDPELRARLWEEYRKYKSRKS